jgi:hypothetical protein
VLYLRKTTYAKGRLGNQFLHIRDMLRESDVVVNHSSKLDKCCALNIRREQNRTKAYALHSLTYTFTLLMAHNADWHSLLSLLP